METIINNEVKPVEPGTNLIVVEAERLELEPETKKSLLDNFKNYFEQAAALKKKALSIKVNDETQVAEMSDAREMRLQISKIRIDVEKTRVKLKTEIVRKGKAIDGFSNIVKDLIEPIETHLKQQENFIKIKEEKELLELEDKRIDELSQYMDDIEFFNLKDMDEKTYQHLFISAKEKHEHAEAANEKAEQLIIENEKKEAAAQILIKKENEKLKKEADKKQKELKIEYDKREKAEAELQKKKVAEEKLRKEQEFQKQAELEKQKEKELAPDKVKLGLLAFDIMALKMPDVKSQEAKDIIVKVMESLNNASNYIKTEIINL